MIIDIHSHIKYENKHFNVESVLSDMAQHNIGKRVISSLNGLNIKENNILINEIASNNPDKLIGCAVINPKLESAIEDVENALSLNYIKMIEFNPFYHGYYPDSEENLDKIFEKISKAKVPVKLFTGIGAYGIPHQWEKYIEKYKDINFIFLHMGCFDYGYACIDVAARHDNTYVEISNQYELQIIRKCLAKINCGKILFGTTYPERLTSSSLIILDLFNLGKNERELIFTKNAEELLGV